MGMDLEPGDKLQYWTSIGEPGDTGTVVKYLKRAGGDGFKMILANTCGFYALELKYGNRCVVIDPALIGKTYRRVERA